MRDPRKWWGAIGLGALLLAGALWPVADHGPLVRALFDAAHIPGFFALGLSLRLGPLRADGLRDESRVLALCALFAVVSEAGQILGPRNASWADLGRDALAVAAALLLARGLRGSRARWVWSAGGVLLLAVGLWPFGRELADRKAQRDAFPRLLETGAGWSARVLDFRDARLLADDGSSLRFAFDAVRHPAVILHGLADWSDYERLEIEVECDRATQLLLRVDDEGHDGSHRDRYERAHGIEAGRTRLRIPLEDIASSPAARQMDLHRMHSITFYLEKGPLELGLRELRLSGAPARTDPGSAP